MVPLWPRLRGEWVLSGNSRLILLVFKLFLWSHTGPEGITSARCQQYYKGHKVTGAHFILTKRGDEVVNSYDHLIKGLNLPGKPDLAEGKALQAAERAIAARLKIDPQSFPWVVAPAEPAPRGSLAIDSWEFAMTPESARLVWSFTIVTSEPFSSHDVHIDAVTGQVVNVMNNIIR